MLERDGYPPGVPCWVDTQQPGPEAAAGFYGDLFGWDFEDRMPDDSPVRYLVARLRGADVAAVGSQPEQAPARSAWNTYVSVENADATAAKVKEAGGSVLMEPFDILDVGRTGMFSDPAGAAFAVWQAGTHRGAQLVNEPGTWNWSTLITPDPEGSVEFYGTVFGWETGTMDLGSVDFTMWRLPGYADFLEVNDPGLRRRHADAGAPEGFSDAVAWMSRMASDDDTPPHWGVTFAVEDTDAIAARAAELGGRVLTPPFDAGPAVRMAMIRDPQGAEFSVSRYQPG
jgi:predicted enzyme related to lactoylglutathione lyase